MTRGVCSHYTYPTPYGPLTIGVRGERVRAVVLGRTRLEGEFKPTELANRCANELMEYFAGKRTAFDVPVEIDGTAFQRSVWEAIGNIPYGQTRTNEEVAHAVGSPRSYRMIGSVVRKNPLAVIVPAHRVVGANGRIAGSDDDARLRSALLEFERRHA